MKDKKIDPMCPQCSNEDIESTCMASLDVR